MKKLLDTCVISDFIKGEPATQNQFRHTPPSSIAISSITAFELRYGLALNPKRAKKISGIIEDIISNITVLPFDDKCATHAANIRAQLKQNGTPIGPYDILIGATAAAHHLTLVSANEKEFYRISEITVENWRSITH